MPSVRGRARHSANPNIGPFTKEDGEVIIDARWENGMSELDLSLPNVRADALHLPDLERWARFALAPHKPRILLLYGSLRSRSYSRFLTFEAARLLERLGAEIRIFDPSGLPLT